MSQFKDLMHGLDDVEAYLIGYRRGHQAGMEQGLKLLHEHMDTCTKPLVVQAESCCCDRDPQRWCSMHQRFVSEKEK